VCLQDGSRVFSSAASAPHILFKEAVWLSIQTQDTIGYGGLNPKSFAANWIVFAQSFSSVVIYALITGLTFAKACAWDIPSDAMRTTGPSCV
jgi:hypothetical protein